MTTAKRADFELVHQERQITPYMDFVLVREDYDRAKPDPEPYRAGLQRFGVTKTAARVVEDSARGLSSAVAAGIDCAVVYNHFTESQDFLPSPLPDRDLGRLESRRPQRHLKIRPNWLGGAEPSAHKPSLMRRWTA